VGVPLGGLAFLLGVIGLLVGWRTTRKTVSIVGALLGVLAVFLSWLAVPVWRALGISSVTATELVRAYEEGPEKADRKYKGKWLQVRGRVRNVYGRGTPAPWSGSVTVHLESEEEGVSTTVTMLARDFIFGGQTYHEMSALQKGEEVTVGGICTGMANGEVELDHPVLLERH
jgi:hypothetical protein